MVLHDIKDQFEYLTMKWLIKVASKGRLYANATKMLCDPEKVLRESNRRTTTKTHHS